MESILPCLLKAVTGSGGQGNQTGAENSAHVELLTWIKEVQCPKGEVCFTT